MGRPGSPFCLRRARHISSIASGERFITNGKQAAIAAPPITAHVPQGNAVPHVPSSQHKTKQITPAMPNRLIAHNRRYGAGKTMDWTTKAKTKRHALSGCVPLCLTDA